MPDLADLVLPALYALTAVLVVAVLITQGGAIPYYLRTFWKAALVIVAVPAIAFALGNYQLLVLLHVLGAFLFVGAHAVSVYVAFQLPQETDAKRAEGLLMLSAQSLDGMHAGLAFLFATGIATAFAGSWWGAPWLWLSLDMLLAITAYMYRAASSPGYTPARHALIDEGGPGWTDATRALVDRGRALRLMVTGMAALVAIIALMVLKPG
jgi:hypothetical protein